MKASRPLIIVWCSLELLASGCQKQESTLTPAAPQVFGNTISFPEQSVPAGVVTSPIVPAGKTTVSLPGRLRWDEDQTVRIFSPYAGRVVKIEAQLGQRVVAGAPLAQLNSPEFGAAQADYQKALAGRNLAQRALERARELLEHGVAARKDVEQAEADDAAANAELTRADRVLQALSDGGVEVTQLLTLRAPIPGVIVERNINPGQEVRPDQSSSANFVVTNPSSMWVQLDARDADIPVLKPGIEFKFTVAAFPNETFTGKIVKVADFVDPTTRTIKVLGHVDNRDHRLKAEMFISASITLEATQSPEAAAASVLFLDNKHYLFVRKGGVFERHEVNVGQQRAGRVQILDGINTNEDVVIEGALYLQALITAGHT
jgi:membrane fusion protein, heavy metal efflux system